VKRLTKDIEENEEVDVVGGKRKTRKCRRPSNKVYGKRNFQVWSKRWRCKVVFY